MNYKTDCPYCDKPRVAPQTETDALRAQLARALVALNRCILLAETLAAAGNFDPAGTAAEIERARAALQELPQ